LGKKRLRVGQWGYRTALTGEKGGAGGTQLQSRIRPRTGLGKKMGTFPRSSKRDPVPRKNVRRQS